MNCLDLSLQTLDAHFIEPAQLIAIYVGMHTATRIAIEAMPRIQAAADAAGAAPSALIHLGSAAHWSRW